MGRVESSRNFVGEIAMIMRIAEELTNRPVGTVSDAMETLMEHLVRYRRAQERMNDVAGFGLNNPANLDVLDACVMLSERYSSLTRSIRGLHQVS